MEASLPGGRGAVSGMALQAVLLVLVLVPGPVVAAEEGRPVRIAIGEWPPYLGSGEPDYGPVSRILSAALARASVPVEYEFHSWQRGLNLARYGKREGTAVWFHSKRRAQDFHISEPVIRSEYVFFHHRDLDFDWDDPEDLRGYRIGITREYDYGEVIEQLLGMEGVHVEQASSDEHNLRKLLAGRIDLFPVDLVVGREMIRREFAGEHRDQLVWHSHPVRSGGPSLLLSRRVPENEDRIRRFDRELRRMHENGETEEIFREALGEDVPVERILP